MELEYGPCSRWH